MSSAMNVIEFPARRAEVEYAEEGVLQAERLRIARELHDVIASSFATIKVHTGVALHLMDGSAEPLGDALRAIDSASKEALGELRAILGMLRSAGGFSPPTPDLDRLDDLAARMTAAGVRTLLIITGDIRSLPPAVDLAAFRIAQESLSNALQHEGPTSAVVRLTYEADCLEVEVENDEGAHAAVHLARPHGSGHGIAGMRERVIALGGDFEVGARPEGGFRVFARLPLFPRSS
jgi:signal transduction histidine kinase